jgi:hypothetical protein
MMAKSRLAWRAAWPLAAVLVVGALVIQDVGQRTGSSATTVGPLDDWDVPRLADYLNSKGLGLRVVSTQSYGGIERRAFLTTTDKGWEELSRPVRSPLHIDRWQGTLICERRPSAADWDDLTRQWEDCCLAAGPFLLFGDRELLGRVRAALSEFTQPED